MEQTRTKETYMLPERKSPYLSRRSISSRIAQELDEDTQLPARVEQLLTEMAFLSQIAHEHTHYCDKHEISLISEHAQRDLSKRCGKDWSRRYFTDKTNHALVLSGLLHWYADQVYTKLYQQRIADQCDDKQHFKHEMQLLTEGIHEINRYQLDPSRTHRSLYMALRTMLLGDHAGDLPGHEGHRYQRYGLGEINASIIDEWFEQESAENKQFHEVRKNYFGDKRKDIIHLLRRDHPDALTELAAFAYLSFGISDYQSRGLEAADQLQRDENISSITCRQELLRYLRELGRSSSAELPADQHKIYCEYLGARAHHARLYGDRTIPDRHIRSGYITVREGERKVSRSPKWVRYDQLGYSLERALQIALVDRLTCRTSRGRKHIDSLVTSGSSYLSFFNGYYYTTTGEKLPPLFKPDEFLVRVDDQRDEQNGHQQADAA